MSKRVEIPQLLVKDGDVAENWRTVNKLIDLARDIASRLDALEVRLANHERKPHMGGGSKIEMTVCDGNGEEQTYMVEAYEVP